MVTLNKIGVFCASSLGTNPVYEQVATQLADYFVQHNIEVVYGGANVGLMGILANRVLAGGGKITGVIPEFLVDKEVAHQHLNQLYIVNSMHERKQKIADMVDGFIILPGGFGSVEEFFEMCTWKQLAIHNKPCAMLNTNHFFDSLIQFMHHACNERFIKQVHLDMIIVEEDILALFEKMHQAQPIVDKWIFDREPSIEVQN